MTSIMCLHFDMQEEDINEHPTSKCNVLPRVINLSIRAGLDLESGLKMGWGERNQLLSLVERLGLASSSLHHELGPINN